MTDPLEFDWRPALLCPALLDALLGGALPVYHSFFRLSMGSMLLAAKSSAGSASVSYPGPRCVYERWRLVCARSTCASFISSWWSW